MKVKKIIKNTSCATYIRIYDSSLSIQYSGLAGNIYIGNQFLDNKVKKVWCDECSLCIAYE